MQKSVRKKRLPPHKKQELDTIRELILSHGNVLVHFIILFGSYARGNWVEDTYVEEGITYTYQSDFDLLVIIDNCDIRKQQKIERYLSHLINDTHSIRTPASLIVHDMKTVNHHLSQRQYFFSDIKREGLKLYDSGEQKLARLKKLQPKVRYQLAVENFDYWYNEAKSSYKFFQFGLVEQENNKAAFNLHQLVESLYHAIFLVYTHYKPKIHDLDRLKKLANSLDNRLIKPFPLATKEEKRLFDLLCKAYIDSRYNKKYRITENELRALEKQAIAMQRLTEELCQEKINLFREEASIIKK